MCVLFQVMTMVLVLAKSVLFCETQKGIYSCNERFGTMVNYDRINPLKYFVSSMVPACVYS